jgi:hypothetical protein
MRATQLHYENGKGYDLIDVISDYELNFNRGNIIKYVCRAGKKDDEIKDLEKALDYLNREIEILRSQRSLWVRDNTL